MNSSVTRKMKFSANHMLTVSDIRSLLQWLDHFGLPENHPVRIRADESQRDGYWFRAVIVMDEAVKVEMK